jgi:hypothetical protein
MSLQARLRFLTYFYIVMLGLAGVMGLLSEHPSVSVFILVGGAVFYRLAIVPLKRKTLAEARAV